MHPKRHPDPISRFATIHTQTDRWRQARTMSASLAMVLESDADALKIFLHANFALITLRSYGSLHVIVT